jgi:hypothetical protein
MTEKEIEKKKQKIDKWASKQATFLLNAFWGRGQWQIWDSCYRYAKKWLVGNYKELKKKGDVKLFKKYRVTLRQD